ncbi:uncharacterized calcium-binding protein At1g02270-like [Xenia sp. Carnegie-2017]|uniref:uncharacterized calcium-binding protein At1g02270-like n=1 Tax=Xenia sp. Carnegie-2017 TaxID=2897299 RepID=UPI001F042F84|nr:uncharacterized calcium-binding protein At1g02270-like [Xenia sp. Carnegie-2017]
MLKKVVRILARKGLRTMAVREANRLKCATFNILAPCYKIIDKCQWPLWHTKESSCPEQYIPRYEAIIQLLKSEQVNADIVCFQEFWFKDFVFSMFHEKLGQRYEIIKLKRLGFKADGLVMLVNKSLKVKYVENISFNDAASRVGLLVHIELLSKYEVIVVTSHLAYGNSYWDQYLRLTEAKKLMDAIDKYSLRHKNIPVILAGDINGPEDSPVCERIFEEDFESAYKTIHGQEPKVTHKDHSENCAAVDFIFYRSTPTCEITPKNSELFPKEYTDNEWPSEFTLSDHRLLTAEFELRGKN